MKARSVHTLVLVVLIQEICQNMNKKMQIQEVKKVVGSVMARMEKLIKVVGMFKNNAPS